MNRREFLAASLAMTYALRAGRAGAQPRPKVRAAIVIGVNSVGTLTKLDGAASGASTIAKWLSDEGFSTVKLFVDDNGPVKVGAISDAVAELVDRGTLDQLVVYFAGHGFMFGSTEVWMLSGAPRNANEAISLLETKTLARRMAIPSVVLISDACRSIANTVQMQSVSGSQIFPNPGVMVPVHTNVDILLATHVGEASIEVPVPDSAGTYEGVFTAALLSAYERPDEGMVVRTADDLRVVPNKNLRPFLERDVAKRVFAVSPTALQVPDIDVVSDDSIYIARVAAVTASGPATTTPNVATIRDVANAELVRVGVRGPGTASLVDNEAIARVKAQSGFSKARDAILRASEPQQVEFDSGFTISGARVNGAMTNPGLHAQLVARGDGEGQPALVMVDMGSAAAASILLGFADGTGTAVAALRGFIGKIAVDRTGVANVSYFPSRRSAFWSEYSSQRKQIDELHATIATAARFGVFRIEGGSNRMQNAERVAGKIRVFKAIDPTLGIYAAYAYADAGLQNQVRSVYGYMHGDLQADLFDVAMLSGDLSGRSPNGTGGIVPFCPMLTQGWGYLRVQGVRVPTEVSAAKVHLRPSLWTTFNKEGIEILLAAMRDGKLR